MKNEPKTIKLYICPTCKTPRPWPDIMSQLGGKGVKNPKKANGKDYSAMGKKSAEVRRLKKAQHLKNWKEVIEFKNVDSATKANPSISPVTDKIQNQIVQYFKNKD